jgi:hypothetical protein
MNRAQSVDAPRSALRGSEILIESELATGTDIQQDHGQH